MNPTILAILIAAGLLAIGLVLRLRVGVFRVLYLPAAVIAGAVGLAIVQVTTRLAHSSAILDTARSVVAEWSSWPGTLIAVVFAGLLLERSQEGGLASALRRGLRSGILAWIIILGQLLIGVIVYVVAVRPSRPNVPATFSQMLEISWAGGHGSAAGMGTLFAAQGFPEGRDLAFFCATVGLIYGVLSGLVFVNLAIRKGWTSRSETGTRQSNLPLRRSESASGYDAGAEASNSAIAVGHVPREAIEPFVVPILILAGAFAAGMILQRGFLTGAAFVFAADDPNDKTQAIDAAANVPLFLFTLIGGWLVRRAMELLGLARFIDASSIARLVGVAMEFLIVAGIATMRIEAINQFGWPLVLLLILAAAWSAFTLLVLSRWLLPKAYWFELGLLNYGFSTANTPQGLMLLRMIDPELRSPATADYAVAAPLSAPFIGGGIVSFLVLPVALQKIGPGWLAGMFVFAIALLAWSGGTLAKTGRMSHRSERRPTGRLFG